MKTNSIRRTLHRSILLLFLQLYFMVLYAQPDYDFRNSILTSGTDLLAGAKYKFLSVKPGVDANVTITNITGGISLLDIDGSSGYPEAFQPYLFVPPMTDGYIEFQIDFLVGGTETLMVQTYVPATPIDVDGKPLAGGTVNEFDEINLGPGAYLDFDMIGGELSIVNTGTWIKGTNTGNIDYPGRDTSAKQVMFTVFNGAISSFIFRTGAKNTSPTEDDDRLRSLYFKKFTYPNSFLPLTDLLSFNGSKKENTIELAWELSTENSTAEIILERGDSPGKFQPIAFFSVNHENNTKPSFTFTDQDIKSDVACYRLKLIDRNRKISYSNILAFRANRTAQQSFSVYPTIFSGSFTAKVQSENVQPATFHIMDYNGRVLSRQQVVLQQGENHVQLNGLDRLPSGNYIGVLKINKKIVTQKIVKN